jgi:hypothetical protein
VGGRGGLFFKDVFGVESGLFPNRKTAPKCDKKLKIKNIFSPKKLVNLFQKYSKSLEFGNFF